jgi:hypothetical protein
MSKYISKSLNEAYHWWKSLTAEQRKQMPPHEYRAAVFYEFLARKHAVKGKLSYPLGKPWPQLARGFRLLLAHKFFPGPSIVPFLEYEPNEISNPNELEIRGETTYSKIYIFRFNLDKNASFIADQMKAFFLDIQKQYAKSKQGLEGYSNRPMTFLATELKDKELRGAPLSKVEKQCIKKFDHDHAKILAHAAEYFRRARRYVATEPSFKKLVYGKSRLTSEEKNRVRIRSNPSRL